MDGLLLRLNATDSGGPRFWKVFGAIRPDLDRLSWHFETQPWMVAPRGFDDEAEYVSPHPEFSLWRPGTLGRYGDHIHEEYVEMWALEPTQDDPAQVAADYAECRGKPDPVIARHARVWMIYTDSTCWEIYARKPELLDRLAEGIDGKPWVTVTRGTRERRGELFGNAGLSQAWRSWYR